MDRELCELVTGRVVDFESLLANTSGGRASRFMLGAALLVAFGGCSVPPECGEYRSVSVADMRSKYWSGCFELTKVVVVARTPSPSGPRVFVQDPKAGDLSAIMAKCSSTSTHACSAATRARVLQLLNGAAVTLRGSYRRGMQTGFEELYLDDVIDHGTLLQTPAPAVLEVADLARSARLRAKWFQVASVTVPDDDPLVVYDLSPTELQLSTATAGTAPALRDGALSCPAWSGFAMIALSAGTDVPADCIDSRNPPARKAPDSREVLIGRRFFDAFSWSGDCACAPAAKQHLLSAANFVVGEMKGVLGLEFNPTSGEAYQVFEPLSKALFPVQ